MPDNPNASRTWATLRIWGRDLDPDSVTALLGVVPSKSFRRGDQRNPRSVWPHGRWSLTSEGQMTSTDLEAHIQWLLDRIEPRGAGLAALREDASVKADVFCFWESATGHGGPEFSPALLSRLGALALPLGIDIYFAQ